MKEICDTICRCRVCLNLQLDQKKIVSLFIRHNDGIISDKICAIANIKVLEGDDLPDKICYDCLSDLENAINFKERCERSDKLLKESFINRQNTIGIVNKLERLSDIKKEELELEFEEYLDEDFILDDVDTKLNVQTADTTEIEIKPDLHIKETEIDKEVYFIVPHTVKKSKAIDLKLECNECGGFFKSKCKMRVHWKKVHLYQALICQFCKRSFKSYRAFNRHKNSPTKSCTTASKINVEGVGKSRIFNCKNCSYSTRRLKDMNSHLTIHTGDRPYICNVCQRGFTQQSSLDAHRETHGIYVMETTCQYCGKHLKGRSRIYTHLKQHKPNYLQCDYCKKMLKNKNCLMNHLKRHNNVKPYTCDKCGKTFYTISDLLNHRRTIHEKGEHIYKCDRCDYTAFKSDSLKKHKSKHTETNLICLTCGKFLDNIEKLTAHQAKHLAERNYCCPHCPKKFLNSKGLSQHVRKVHRCTYLVKKSIKPDPESESPSLSKKSNSVIEIEFPRISSS